MDKKDLQIIAQSAGAHAATIVAADIVAGGSYDDLAAAVEEVRKQLFYGVLELVNEAESAAVGAVVHAFPGAGEAPPVPAAAPVPVPPSPSPAQQTPPPPPGGHGGGSNACPQCGGEAWDNRQNKRNPKAPDFKCKEKNGACKDKSGQYPYGWWIG